MTTGAVEIPPAKAEDALYRQIASHLRTEIAKEYRHSNLLPSERDLAARYTVNQRTVRQALEVLAREGVIARYPRRGFIIVDRNATGEFAIVVRPHLLRTDASPYFSLTSTAIAEIMGARNSRWTSKLHVGRTTERQEDYPSTLDLVEPDVLRRLRGVFSFHNLGTLDQTLRDARVPVVYLSRERDCNVVVPDYQGLYATAFAHLKNVGCRRVGAFTVDSELSAVSRFAEAQRLRIGAEWVQPYPVVREAELWGYNTFFRLWKKSSHPDGLLVGDDMMCRGVLRAILQLNVDIPHELRLISHANSGVLFPYHKAITRVEFDLMAQARTAVDLMTDLLRDPEAPTRFISIPGTLMKGETT